MAEGQKRGVNEVMCTQACQYTPFLNRRVDRMRPNVAVAVAIPPTKLCRWRLISQARPLRRGFNKLGVASRRRSVP